MVTFCVSNPDGILLLFLAVTLSIVTLYNIQSIGSEHTDVKSNYEIIMNMNIVVTSVPVDVSSSEALSLFLLFDRLFLTTFCLVLLVFLAVALSTVTLLNIQSIGSEHMDVKSNYEIIMNMNNVVTSVPVDVSSSEALSLFLLFDALFLTTFCFDVVATKSTLLPLFLYFLFIRTTYINVQLMILLAYYGSRAEVTKYTIDLFLQ